MTITILDSNRNPMTTCSESMAHRLEKDFQVCPTTDPNTRRFLSPTERDRARAAHVRRITGLAHPHDHATDEDANWLLSECPVDSDGAPVSGVLPD